MSDQSTPANAFIKAKEYENKKWLCYPSEELKHYFREIQSISTNILKSRIDPKNIKTNDYTTVLNNCPQHKHELKSYFQESTINIIFYSCCRSINRILSGKLKYQGEDDDTETKAVVL